jgi:hypothetical protein
MHVVGLSFDHPPTQSENARPVTKVPLAVMCLLRSMYSVETNGVEGRGRRQSPAVDHIPFQPAADSSSPRASLLTCRCSCMSSKFPPRAYRDANLVPSMPRPLVLAWGTSVVCRARGVLPSSGRFAVHGARVPHGQRRSMIAFVHTSPLSSNFDDGTGVAYFYVASAPLNRGG